MWETVGLKNAHVGFPVTQHVEYEAKQNISYRQTEEAASFLISGANTVLFLESTGYWIVLFHRQCVCVCV